MGAKFLCEMQAVIIPEHLLCSLAQLLPAQRFSFTFLWQRERHCKLICSQYLEENKLLIMWRFKEQKNLVINSWRYGQTTRSITRNNSHIATATPLQLMKIYYVLEPVELMKVYCMSEPVLRGYLFPHSCITVTTKVNNTAILCH